MTTTRQAVEITPDDVNDLLAAVADDDEESGTYDGASNLEPEFRGSPEAEFAESFAEPEIERVLLVNIEHPQETFYIPDPVNGQFSGDKVQFQDSYLNTTPEIAAFIKQANPNVYEEPKEGGEPFVFQKTGFRTRSREGYERYLNFYYNNQ